MKNLLGRRISKLGAEIVPSPPAESDDKSYKSGLPNEAAEAGLARIMVGEPATMSNKGENMVEQV